ncbi:hypothetical protein BgiMline_011727, partial [Biomphalaria glabrata]
MNHIFRSVLNLRSFYCDENYDVYTTRRHYYSLESRKTLIAKGFIEGTYLKPAIGRGQE